MTPGHSEIEAQFTAFMESCGITPPRDGVILDGKIHRFATEADKHGGRSGAYQLHADGLPAGWVQDFHLGEPVRWKFKPASPLAEGLNYHPSSLGRAEAEALRQKENASKLAAAWSAYQKAISVEEAPDHPYLQHKCITPRGGFLWRGQWCGLRAGSMTSASGRVMSDLLLIPLQDIQTGRFCALHRVFGRPGADKRFSKGWATSASGVYPVAGDVQYGPVFVGEGISTMLSVYESYTESRDGAATVLAAMSSDNLIKQAPAIRRRWAGRQLIVIADDDPAGEKAAAACLSAGFGGSLKAGDSLGF